MDRRCCNGELVDTRERETSTSLGSSAVYPPAEKLPTTSFLSLGSCVILFYYYFLWAILMARDFSLFFLLMKKKIADRNERGLGAEKDRSV